MSRLIDPQPTRWRQSLLETALVFAVFFVEGAWPVPDVNEPYYLGQAIRAWNADWLPGDFFLATPSTHRVFCYTFGWLALWLTPTALAWTGRVITWAALAWAWRRLSFAVVPRRWCSVLTAALFVFLMDRCHMAGEWVIGGVEAKGLAYVFAFLGMEAIVRGRWNRALAWFGVASAFHVVVGGWMAVGAGLAWLLLKTFRRFGRLVGVPRLKTLWPGIVLGFALSLPGLVPAMLLDRGVDAATAQHAHEIYVFERLSHHLTFAGIRPAFMVRLGLLAGLWVLLGLLPRRLSITPRENGVAAARIRFRAFVAATILVALAGAALHGLLWFDRGAAADLLRFYWFRLADVAIPLGVALEGVALLVLPTNGKQTVAHCGWLAAAFAIAAIHLGGLAWQRVYPEPPRADKNVEYAAWREACDWASRPENVPPDARFLTPRLAQTFGWYSGHGQVVGWKDVPQDAVGLLEWRRRLEDLCATGQEPPQARWRATLAELGAKRLKELGAKYKADYVITEATTPPLPLDIAHRNTHYIIYRLPKGGKP